MEIILEDVNKWYGTKPVLKNINLTINNGITGLLGPNGAGKTTLISIISGLMRPSSGKITINGQDPFYNTNIRKYIGLLPENSNPPEHFTILEFLKWQATLVNADNKEIDRVIDITDIKRYKKRKIKYLSKGMKQRLKFAAALLGDPPILLLDEPFNGIDPSGRKTLRDLILSYKDQKTIIFSSHILEEVQMVATTIVVLKFGFVIAEGTPVGIRKLLTDIPYKVRIKSSNPIKLINILFEKKLIKMAKLEINNNVIVETFSFHQLASELPQIAIEEHISIDAFVPEDVKLEKLFEYLTMRGDIT